MTQFDFLRQQADIVAPQLLGWTIERRIGNQQLMARIVETEAYDQTDMASHSYKGKTPRTSVMFGPAGHLYVYFIYGMHYCMNIVTGSIGEGSAVLIRAVEPLSGESIMVNNRRGCSGPNATNGPAKTCQALSIDTSLNGYNLISDNLDAWMAGTAKIRLVTPSLEYKQSLDIVQTTRIGISQAKDVPWRFYIKGNRYVSRPYII